MKDKQEILKKTRLQLSNAGLSWEEFNNGWHWKMGEVNFYPTTGRWFDFREEGRGLESLLKYLKPKPKSQLSRPGQETILREPSVIDKRKLSVEQIFDVAKKTMCRPKDHSLFNICEEIHKAIYE